MSRIEVHSPTRVDLAGGTVDLWPLYLFVGGAKTVNVAIDIYTSAVIESLPGTAIELSSLDLGAKRSYNNLQECLADPDERLKLLQVQLRYWRPQRGFRLTTSSQSPVGAGIGASSSLTVTLMKAFAQFCERPMKSVNELVHVAHNLEAEVLQALTGTQDYYPAASGGLNILDYSSKGINQEVLDFDYEDFNKHFVLVYTGRSHNSGINNFEVVQKAVAGDKATLAALAEVRDIANEMSELCRKKGFSSISSMSSLFKREFEARLRLAKAFASPEIEKLFNMMTELDGAQVKICGAGGGGCVMIWTEPINRKKVQDTCQKAGFQVLNAKAVAPAAQLNLAP